MAGRTGSRTAGRTSAAPGAPARPPTPNNPPLAPVRRGAGCPGLAGPAARPSRWPSATRTGPGWPTAAVGARWGPQQPHLVLYTPDGAGYGMRNITVSRAPDGAQRAGLSGRDAIRARERGVSPRFRPPILGPPGSHHPGARCLRGPIPCRPRPEVSRRGTPMRNCAPEGRDAIPATERRLRRDRRSLFRAPRAAGSDGSGASPRCVPHAPPSRRRRGLHRPRLLDFGSRPADHDERRLRQAACSSPCANRTTRWRTVGPAKNPT